MELAGSLAEAVGLRKRLGGDQRRVEPAPRQRRRRLAGDEAGADDDGTGAGAPRAAQAQGVVDACGRVQAGVLGAGTGGRCGREPVASTQAS